VGESKEFTPANFGQRRVGKSRAVDPAPAEVSFPEIVSLFLPVYELIALRRSHLSAHKQTQVVIY